MVRRSFQYRLSPDSSPREARPTTGGGANDRVSALPRGLVWMAACACMDYVQQAHGQTLVTVDPENGIRVRKHS